MLTFAMVSFGSALNIGLLHYEIWGQIDYLSRATFDFSSLGVIAHAPRYFVVSPTYLIAAWFDLEPDIVFGWYVFVLISATAALWLAIRVNIANTRPTDYFGFLIPFVLAVAINGRFAFGLFGLSMICLGVIRMRLAGMRVRFILMLLVGLLFSSVSSGLFTVGLLFAALTASDFWRSNSSFTLSPFKKRLLQIGFVTLSIPLCGLLWIFLVKNLSYYGDGVEGAIDMLSHGLGLFVNPYPLVEYCRSEGNDGLACQIGEQLADSVLILTMVMFILAFAIVSLLLWFRYTDLNKLARRGIALSLLGGVFGLTTLFSILFVLPAWIGGRDANIAFARAARNTNTKLEDAMLNRRG